eukprot:a841999_163.p1 GENE.a841999_163~~a841999_163.p1  ORF type:complete len:171 (-),score=88.00 a841999_163:30-512(-)
MLRASSSLVRATRAVSVVRAAAQIHASAFARARDASKLKYTKDHEWIDVKGNVGTVGITAYAAHKLGEIVHVELPAVGETKAVKESFGALDSTKAVSDVYSPVSGEIVEVNSALEKNAAIVSESPLDDGWLMKIKLSNPAEVSALLDLKAYEQHVKDTDH